MEQQPKSLRRHVVILGRTNAGKSTLMNALLGQERAITAPQPGTTTDPVQAAMELIPFGPIVLIDTAGLEDTSALGTQRESKTYAVARRADAALYTVRAGADMSAYLRFAGEGLPHVLALTHWDLADTATRASLLQAYPNAVPMPGNLDTLREKLVAVLSALAPEADALVGDLLPTGSHVLLVTPIDSAAPKGRLILPQVQTLRDCLDHGMLVTLCRETELEQTLARVGNPDLVVTDSQVFGLVAALLPRETKLTSFSMLLARQKGGFAQLLAGVRGLSALKNGDRVLMLEGCTHNSTHEDIGRVKIPAMLQKKLGLTLSFDYASGYDFPRDITPYALAIQCGGCMLGRREIAARLSGMAASALPVTNYGVVLAWGSGILERACEIFEAAL